MTTDHSPESGDVPVDGFCPTCGALDDEACATPGGNFRRDHAARHPSPRVATPPGGAEQ